jgi:sugar lactone lactonase YvrE
LYVADTGNNRIQKLKTDGTFVDSWGSYGNENALLDSPADVAVDSSGYIYVADTGNNRIQKFNPDGTWNSTWGTQGSRTGQFNKPSGIAVDSQGYVYVSDTENHRIQKFDSNGRYICSNKFLDKSILDLLGIDSSLIGIDKDNFLPIGIDVDGSGNVWVADNYGRQIHKFDADLNYSICTGSLIDEDADVYSIYGLTVTPQGFVYVMDYFIDCIHKYDNNGKWLSKTGYSGSHAGQFLNPYGIASDKAGNLYIADTRSNRIQVLSWNDITVTPVPSPSHTVVSPTAISSPIPSAASTPASPSTPTTATPAALPSQTSNTSPATSGGAPIPDQQQAVTPTVATPTATAATKATSTSTPTSTPKPTPKTTPAAVEPSMIHPGASVDFSDIKNHWAKDYIINLVLVGLIDGYPDNTVRPENYIKREEVVKIIVKLLVNEPEKNPQIHFADKDKIPDWVKGYLNTAVNRGIIKGYDDNTFRGSNYISRAEMTAVVLRALEIKPEDQNYSRL